MNAVFLRLATMLILGTSLAFGCECSTPNIRDARKHAEIVFRGRITGFRDTGNGTQAVIFTVDRVWKGDVPQTFEMPAFGVACIGFWPSFLEIGNNLLVYAYRTADSPDYLPDPCSRTTLAEKSKDFAKLGAGYQPKPK